MPELIPVLKREEIEELTASVAQQISSDYKGHPLVIIGVLKGAFIFLADLVRQITIPVQVDFVKAASYGSGATSSGKIELTKEIDIDIAGKDVLVVEDIVDSGLTLAYLIDYLKKFKPESVRICTLLDKYERRQSKVKVDYACYTIEKGFLVGYGLDYDEAYRELPAIYHLKFQ
ncbi:MAG: hypoxanthine phosphoribosyltransferase [Desulfobacterales bacterium]|nr:hypoxanthine phosphoribosyltransferase [Desulfobacterales bacterium]